MKLASSLLALCAAAACSCGDKDRVATVGGSALAEPDVKVQMERSGDRARAIDALVETALLFEGAKRAGLDKDRAIQARAADAQRQVLGSALLQQRMQEATSEAALKKRYDTEKDQMQKRRVHVAHIVIHDGADAPTKIADVLARLRDGEPFDAVAKARSEDPASAARGGALPVIEDGQIDAVFFEAAWRLKSGETSDVVKTAFGMHVIHALADPETVTPSFEEARSALEARAMREAKKALLDELRQAIPVTEGAKP